MKHVMQHPATRLCGHACLAMILGISLDDAIKKMGHQRTTKTRELVAALGKRAKDKRLIPVRQREIPVLAVLKVTWTGRRASHYVVHFAGNIYDPLMPGRMVKPEWDRWLKGRGRVTSALHVGR